MKRKIPTGYSTEETKIPESNQESFNNNNEDDFGKKKKKETSYAAKLIIYDKKNKIALGERIVKFLILIALRIVIKPSMWKDKKRNYDLIDRTYDRIMSADFIYIPSSIAFYVIMAFMPIISLIMFISSQDFMHSIIFVKNSSGKEENAIANILGSFIPGMKDLLNQIQTATSGTHGGAIKWSSNIAIVVSLIISVWIASGGFSKLVFTLSHIYGHKYLGGYWMNKLRGFWMVLVFTTYLLLALVVNVMFENALAKTNWSSLLRAGVRYTFLIVGLFFLVFFGIIAFFRFSPRFKTKIRWIIPGAMTTTLPIVLFLALFSSISHLWSYKEFGAIGAIMYLAMASLNITYFIFVGIIVNASYHKTFVGKVHKKWTVSKK